MKNCCISTNNDNKCIRKSDNKIFKLPRKFSKKKCKKIKGFSMKSSCAPYNDCNGGKKLTYKKNINGDDIEICSKNPLTGFKRDGYCMTGDNDLGTHTICAVMNNEFLNYTKKKGNDLSNVVKPGDKWCICQNRWKEAYMDNKAPKVIKSSTNMRTNDDIIKLINTQNGGNLPKLRKIDKSNKKHIYKLKDPHKIRILAIDEGIRDEIKKGKTKKEAALSKKKRFNVLRLYRKNSDLSGCRKLTKDMKYIDKKYNIGNTNNVCIKGGNKKTKNKYLFNPNNPEKSFDVYIDKNKKDTIPIKYKTLNDVKKTIKKLEKLYKSNKYSHKRIGQVAMIMKVRLNVLKDKKKKQYQLADKYYSFLKKRTKFKNDSDRKKLIFKFN